jgi:hypothetical protein
MKLTYNKIINSNNINDLNSVEVIEVLSKKVNTKNLTEIMTKLFQQKDFVNWGIFYAVFRSLIFKYSFDVNNATLKPITKMIKEIQSEKNNEYFLQYLLMMERMEKQKTEA